MRTFRRACLGLGAVCCGVAAAGLAAYQPWLSVVLGAAAVSCVAVLIAAR